MEPSSLSPLFQPLLLVFLMSWRKSLLLQELLVVCTIRSSLEPPMTASQLCQQHRAPNASYANITQLVGPEQGLEIPIFKEITFAMLTYCPVWRH